MTFFTVDRFLILRNTEELYKKGIQGLLYQGVIDVSVIAFLNYFQVFRNNLTLDKDQPQISSWLISELGYDN